MSQGCQHRRNDPLRPKIGAKPPAGDSAFGGDVDAAGKVGAASAVVDCPPEGHAVHIKEACEVGLVEVSVSHALDVTLSATLVNTGCNIARTATTARLDGMNTVWPQRERFRDLCNEKLKEVMAARLCSQTDALAIIGMEIGLSGGTLRSYMYDTTRKPRLGVLEKAAIMFGLPLADLWTDPNAPIPGMAEAGDASHLSEAKRLVARMMYQDLKSDALSDEEALAYYQAWKGFMEVKRVSRK